MSNQHKHPTISFRISDAERRQIEAHILASGMKNCGQSKKRICGAGHDGRRKPERAVPQIRHQPSNRLQVARAVQRRRDDARPAAHAVPEAFQNQSGCGAADRGCAGRTSNVGRSENPTFFGGQG